MDISLSTLFSPVNRFISKYHPTIFLAVICLLLAGGIFSLYLVLGMSSASTDDTAGPTISSTFDESTIRKIQQLRESNETTTTLSFPSPRSNPFVE